MVLNLRRIEVIDDRSAAMVRAMPLIEKVRRAEAMMRGRERRGGT